MVCCSIQLVFLSSCSTWNFPLNTLLLNSPTVELLTLRKAGLLLVLDCGSCGQKPHEEDSRCSLPLSRPDGAGFAVLRITVVAR